MLDLDRLKKDYKAKLKALKALGKKVDADAALAAQQAPGWTPAAQSPAEVMLGVERWAAGQDSSGNDAVRARVAAVYPWLAGQVDDTLRLCWLLSLPKLFPQDKRGLVDAGAPPEGLLGLLLGWLQCIPGSAWGGRQGAFDWALALADDAGLYGLMLLGGVSSRQDHAKDIARHLASVDALVALAEALPTIKSATQRKHVADALRFGARRELLPALRAAEAAEAKAPVKKMLAEAVREAELASPRLGQPDRHRELRGARIAFSGGQFFDGKYASRQTAMYLRYLQARARFLGAEVVGADSATILFVAPDGAPGGPGEALGGRDLFELLGLRWFCASLEPLPTLQDWGARFHQMTRVLEDHPDVTVEVCAIGDGLSDAAIDAAVAGSAGFSVRDDLRTLCRQADGITLRWRFGEVSGSVLIPPLAEVLADRCGERAVAEGVVPPVEVSFTVPEGFPVEVSGADFLAGLRGFDVFAGAAAAFFSHPESAETLVAVGGTGGWGPSRARTLTDYLEGLLNSFGEAGYRAEVLPESSGIQHHPFGWGPRCKVMFARAPGD